MYVEYEIPIGAIPRTPVVFLPGGFHTSATYDETPDGREGWRSYFVRSGHPVYMAEHVGHGPSGFDQRMLDRARIECQPELLPPMLSMSHEDMWDVFRFGPSFPKFHDGTQFPTEFIDHYWAQIVPNTEIFQESPYSVTIDAIGSLLNRIGPAILVGHSQSGRFVVPAAIRHPNLVRGVINLEPACGEILGADPERTGPPDPLALPPVEYQHGLRSLASVPFLYVWGDNMGDNVFWQEQQRWATEFVELVRDFGGVADHLRLPEVGQLGNSHMLMLERNNESIADLILDWIAKSIR
jgi:pimeloyl-ACP methyl ester carboxylesterase